MNASTQRTAGVRQAQRETAATRGVEWIVARVEVVGRPDRRLRVGEIGDLRDGNVSVHVRSDIELVVALDVLQAVNQREAVESMQPVSVCDRSTFAQLLISERERVVRGAVEERDAETVRRIEEPGVSVGKREEVQTIAGLEAESEVLAFAEEVARRKLRLHEESRPLGVASAELDVVLAFL